MTVIRDDPLVFTRSSARAVDADAIRHWDLPGLVLMENAARAVTDVVDAAAATRPPTRATDEVLIFCGGGNNGGDGWAVARQLANRMASRARMVRADAGERESGSPPPVAGGPTSSDADRYDLLPPGQQPAVRLLEPVVVPIVPPSPGTDAARQAAITRRMSVAVRDPKTVAASIEAAAAAAAAVSADSSSGDAGAGDSSAISSTSTPADSSAPPMPIVVVDALLGTGADRPVDGVFAEAIEMIAALRRRGAIVVSVDVPSGLDCDRGEPLGLAVTADQTVSFLGWKIGFLRRSARPYIGTVTVGDIGVPWSILRDHGRRLSMLGGEGPTVPTV